MFKFESVADVRFVTNFIMEKINEKEKDELKVLHDSNDIYRKYEEEITTNILTYSIVDVRGALFLDNDNIVTVTFKVPDEVLTRRKNEMDAHSELSSAISKKYYTQTNAIREWRDKALKIMGRKNPHSSLVPELPEFCQEYFT